MKNFECFDELCIAIHLCILNSILCIIWIIILPTMLRECLRLPFHILSLLYIHHKQAWYTHIHARAYYSILLLLLYEVNINSFFMFSFLQRCKNWENETFLRDKSIYWGRSWFHFLSIKFLFRFHRFSHFSFHAILYIA
jgi:hypothetical protein